VPKKFATDYMQIVIYTNVMVLKIPVSAVALRHNNCIAVKAQVKCLT